MPGGPTCREGVLPGRFANTTVYPTARGRLGTSRESQSLAHGFTEHSTIILMTANTYVRIAPNYALDTVVSTLLINSFNPHNSPMQEVLL